MGGLVELLLCFEKPAGGIEALEYLGVVGDKVVEGVVGGRIGAIWGRRSWVVRHVGC